MSDKEPIRIMVIDYPDTGTTRFLEYLIDEVYRATGAMIVMDERPKVDTLEFRQFEKISEYIHPSNFEPKKKKVYLPYGHTTRPACPKKIKSKV